MEKTKYDSLRSSFLACLKTKQPVPFQKLLLNVEDDIAKRKIKVEGKLEWNLFWVTLDLEARHGLIKNRSSSPIRYSVA